MSYVTIKEGIEITCQIIGNQYQYFIKNENEEEFSLGLNPKEPLELSNKSAIGIDIWNYLKSEGYGLVEQVAMNNRRREEFSRIINDLQIEIDSQKIEKEKEKEKTTKNLHEKYIKLKNYFEMRAKQNNYTKLQFLTQINHGLGVGLTVEVTKAFFGFYQTYIGLKGTNVIAIGNQSGGKSHIIETALSMIPPEKVHIGVKSVAHFFRTFNGQDLTGHIFYLGDLGGENDNQNTIELRDLLKTLTTDGYVERGVADEGIPEDQYVTGYPCLTYTTVNEDMINAQEKSRSIIITPPDIDPHKLEDFNFLMKNPGTYKPLIDDIKKDKESVKGLVHESQSILDIEIFNPYMHNVTDFLKEVSDFNRKINEFNAILKLVCLLSDPFIVTHNLYLDENYDDKETKMIVARKQDVINALHLFDHNSDLLPTEIALANGLIKKFEPYELMGEQKTFDTVADFEEEVKVQVPYHRDGSVDWDNLTSPDDENKDYFFTGLSLRKKYGSQKWYNRNKDNLFDKLDKLHKANLLILIGKSDIYNVYGLVNNIKEKFTDTKPIWEGKSFERGKDLFRDVYPDLFEEVYEIISVDAKKNLKNIDLELEGGFLYDVPWR